MRKAAALLSAVALSLLACADAAADIDLSEYEPASALRTAQERDRMRERIEEEMEMERKRDALQAEAERRAGEEAARREAARPYPERLTEQRCTACHTAQSFYNVLHTWLGWRIVVARMAWLNGARIDAREQAVIVSHLVQTRPAGAATRLIEYGLPLLVGMSGVVALGAVRRRQGRLRKHTEGAKPWSFPKATP